MYNTSCFLCQHGVRKILRRGLRRAKGEEAWGWAWRRRRIGRKARRCGLLRKGSQLSLGVAAWCACPVRPGRRGSRDDPDQGGQIDRLAGPGARRHPGRLPVPFKLDELQGPLFREADGRRQAEAHQGHHTPEETARRRLTGYTVAERGNGSDRGNCGGGREMRSCRQWQPGRAQ